jgi:hypothetical protein
VNEFSAPKGCAYQTRYRVWGEQLSRQTDLGNGIERNLKMKYIFTVLRSVLIISLVSSIVAEATDSEKPDFVEQTIESIMDYMDQSPAPWPDKWKQEYIETIRKAIELHPDVPHYGTRLEILTKGFKPYWQSFKKTSDRSLFEVHRAQIRWYIENLMNTQFPTEGERKKLRNQYTDIWNYAADSLLKQFPFLDPNIVMKTKVEHLSECYCKIESPLMPVYLKPMSEEQVEQIKQRWDKLCYARIDLWRELDGNSTMPDGNSDAPSQNAKRDYRLTKESLSQLLGLVRMIVPQRESWLAEH